MIRDKNTFFFRLRQGLDKNGNDRFDGHMCACMEAADLFKSGASDDNDFIGIIRKLAIGAEDKLI